MDAQGRDIDPADQWELDPVTGTYRLRLDPERPAATQGSPDHAPDATAGPSRSAPRVGGPDSRTPRADAPPPQPAGVPATPAVPHARTTHGGRRGACTTAADHSAGRPAAPVPGQRGGRGRRKAKPRMSRKKKALAWTGGVTGFAIMSAAVGGYLVYEHFNHNITTVDVGDAGSKGVTHSGPMNILLIGTDSRQGLGGAYGDASNVGHADTTILFHVSADRTNATAMSIPRDIVTSIPQCPTRQKDGSVKVIPGSPRHRSSPKFNESLGQDGRDPGCTMRLVTRLTGIRIDHFMMVDFEAVKTLSTAVGGVPVCLNRPLVDPGSHLDLSAGPHRLKGEQALEFVRTRHALKNQSDLDRIKLQQNFLGSMIRQIKSTGLLTNPSKLYTLADAATRALTVDRPIGTVSKLKSLADDLGRIGVKNIAFTTLPVIDNPAEGSHHVTVLPDPTRAPQLFALIKNDVSLTATKKGRPAPDPRLAGPKATAHNTRVTVLNGSGVFGAAQGTINWLQNTKGVNRSDNGGDAPARLAQTRLDYAPNQADQARSLAAMMGLPAAALHMGTVDAEPLHSMTLTLGRDFTTPGVPIAAPTAPPKDLPKTDAASAECVG